MKIFYIHGANSTKRSFAWLVTALNERVPHTAHFFEYDTRLPAFENIQRCQAEVDTLKPDVIVGHSLGGIFAAYMDCDAKKVSVASPFGGSAIANWLPMYSQLMRDVATTSLLVRGLRTMKVDAENFLSIVANGLDGAGFDGIISHTSQTSLNTPEYKIHNLNHFEVLVDEKVVDDIHHFLCPPHTS